MKQFLILRVHLVKKKDTHTHTHMGPVHVKYLREGALLKLDILSTYEKSKTKQINRIFNCGAVRLLNIPVVTVIYI